MRCPWRKITHIDGRAFLFLIGCRHRGDSNRITRVQEATVGVKILREDWTVIAEVGVSDSDIIMRIA